MNEKRQQILSYLAVIGRGAPFVLLAVFLLLALGHGLDTVAGISWTNNFDSLRDVGGAHSILAGSYPEDPGYTGETLWYNPLISALVAGASWLFGIDPMDADIRLGPWLALAAPLAFFVFMTVTFDRWTALAAAAWLIFGKTPDQPIWTAATYSPWLLAGNFTQSLFWGCLTAYVMSRRRPGKRWPVAVGILWGLAFLGHTAPALVIGIVLLGMTCLDLWMWRYGPRERETLWPLLGRFALPTGIAFALSLPYTYPIWAAYGFHIRNPWPTWYVDPFISLERLPAFLWGCCSITTVLAAVGLGALLLRRETREEAKLVTLALGVSMFLLAYCYVWQAVAASGANLPHLVPGHHSLLFLYAVKAVLFGYGSVYLVMAVTNKFSGKMGGPRIDGRVRQAMAGLLIAIAVLAVHYPKFRTWPDFTFTHDRASYEGLYGDARATYDWVASNTNPDDVFLCEWDLAVRLVAPAGRKLVANMIWYSNIYVDFQERVGEKDALFKAIRDRDEAAFKPLAAKRDVRYLLAQKRAALSKPDGLEPCIEDLDATAWPPLSPVFQVGRYAIYRVVY
jgi:hypothetical protein